VARCPKRDRATNLRAQCSVFVFSTIPSCGKFLSLWIRREWKALSLPIFFTPQQANEFLPEVREIVQRAIAIKKRADSSNDDDSMTEAMEKLEKEIQKLEELGCVLKDMTMGLVDFPAVRLGTRVWLCWKFGEPDVSFWHGLHEGFAGRKPIEKEGFYDDDLAIRSLGGEIFSKPQT
jgi:hypothetical protein